MDNGTDLNTVIMNNKQNNKRSFTLLESIVAIYVLMMGLVGAMTLTQYSISTSVIFEKELVASNLAQEGIELVRNVRDTVFKSNQDQCEIQCSNFEIGIINASSMNVKCAGLGPSSGNLCDYAAGVMSALESACFDAADSDRGCRVEWNNSSDVQNKVMQFSKCPSQTSGYCPVLNYHLLDDLYTYEPVSSGVVEGTDYKRTIFVIPLGGGADRMEWRVISKVSWKSRFAGQSSITVESIFSPWL